MQLQTEVIKERLRLARASLNYTQKQMAAAVGSALPSWKDYEAGKRMPVAQVFFSLVKLGFNANWLLTGEGPTRLEDDRREEIDGYLLADILSAVDAVSRSLEYAGLQEEKGIVAAKVYNNLLRGKEKIELIIDEGSFGFGMQQRTDGIALVTEDLLRGESSRLEALRRKATEVDFDLVLMQRLEQLEKEGKLEGIAAEEALQRIQGLNLLDSTISSKTDQQLAEIVLRTGPPETPDQ